VSVAASDSGTRLSDDIHSVEPCLYIYSLVWFPKSWGHYTCC
jgi:hypothetical protein